MAPNFHQRLSLPRILMDMLDISNSGKEATITAMQAMSEAHEAGGEYGPSRAIKAGVYPCASTARCRGCTPTATPAGSSARGPPKEVWYLMVETWTVVGAPSNARIAEGISGWERVCDKIIEAGGTIVLDENFRTGRRARKMHGEGDLKTKLRKRDRKSTPR